ncbi:uncharacterized protein [Lolium perenne]|uniref:uncharacterized protein n=1 Tax=Lolium perenne TaxID=4522 RepID=UPI0021EA14EA|nr:formin-like protein 7 [Lolium perenne]
MDAGGALNAVAVTALAAESIAGVQYTRFPTPTTDDDLDDLYGDFDLGFLPLPPLSPSPSSPPKTPSPGLSLPSPTPSSSPSPSPSPPPRRTPSPDPHRRRQPEPEPNPIHQHQPPLPAPKSPTQQHQPPPPRAAPNPPPSPRHQPPLPAPKAPTLRLQRAPARPAPSPSPPTATALYIGDLPWWTTDAELEAALAPHGELRGLHFFADKPSGKSRGHCRADFLHPAAAASAAAALHGRAFDGHHCVASLSRPPALQRADADSDAPPPNPALARANNRGNAAFLGDGSSLGPMAPRPRAFGAMIGDGGGFPPVGQCGPMAASHVNPAYLAASRMAMCGNGAEMWHNQGMPGGFWGGPQPWNFGGCEMPWQQPGQQYRNGDYGKMRSTGRERPGGRNEDRDAGNFRGNPNRRQCGRGGGERPGDRDRRWEQRERNYDDRDRRGGQKRRYQEYSEREDWQKRGRARLSQSRNSDDDDDPRRQSRDSDDDEYLIRRR